MNGVWGFAADRKGEGEREAWFSRELQGTESVTVPHIWQREAEYVHYCGTAWYEKSFRAADFSGEGQIYLCFGAVDFQARVWLNGQFIGEHEGGFTPFDFDVTQAVNLEGENRLTVRVYDPQDNAEIPIGKQGSWYTRISGIWQDVYLESRSSCFIQYAHVHPYIDEGIAAVRMQLSEAPAGGSILELSVTNHLQTEQVVAKVLVPASDVRIMQNVELPDAVWWTPEQPHLYDLRVRLLKTAGGDVVDEYETYFGMRSVEFSDGQLYLNHKPLFVRGALDQAYYPDTIYAAPSDEWIRNEIRLAKQMGFNLLRKHIKVEIPRYLYWADRMGMLIWAEPPNVVKWSAQSRRRFYDELLGMIIRDFNRPSILIWSLYNEEWGLEWDLANDKEKQEHVMAMYDAIKVLDPTRLICDNSGWIHVKTDINDYHRYYVVPEQHDEWKSDIEEYMAGTPEANYVKGYVPKGEPIIVSEFGVWGLPSVKKLKEFYGGEPSWFGNVGDDTHREDFKNPLNAEAKFEKYQLDRIFGDMENLSVHSQKRMHRAVKALIEEMRKHPGINGYVVTEFTDVEWETNGWLDYTRQLKLGMDRAADFNGGLIVMADRISHNLWSGQQESWDIVISNHDLVPLQGVLSWSIEGTEAAGTLKVKAGEEALLRLENAISFEAPDVPEASFYTLKLSLELEGGRNAVNEEELTISPPVQIETAQAVRVNPYLMSKEFGSRLSDGGMVLTDTLMDAEVVITSVLDEAVMEYYRGGGHVIFLAEEGDRLSQKEQFTFRELVQGESWDRTSSFNYVDPAYFEGVPLQHEMGWEMEGLYPDYVIPLSNYNKLGGTIGRVVYMFGNENITETSEIISGYFQGWLGQAGSSLLVQRSAGGSLTLTTWKLKDNYGKHPIATQIVNTLLGKCRKQ
ncbi:glycoside hydrolase family 2 protein [Paenibacillus dakarensis]|uniref:glycoside hydrolase family 2 protein n=1 Tax=Paenibacillus dakarensis TaxID=1527293 RepID=UPI0014790069|nr:sugar-binding domain-containing protein [Paenibacillus dakarensis]